MTSSNLADLEEPAPATDRRGQAAPSRRGRWFAVSRERLRAPANRGVLLAIAFGFLLRLGWALYATQPPVRLSDPWHYQQFATSFSFHSTMMIGGVPTAFYPPGYAMALAPLAWLTRKTGVIDLTMAACCSTLRQARSPSWLSPRWLELGSGDRRPRSRRG